MLKTGFILLLAGLGAAAGGALQAAEMDVGVRASFREAVHITVSNGQMGDVRIGQSETTASGQVQSCRVGGACAPLLLNGEDAAFATGSQVSLVYF